MILNFSDYKLILQTCKAINHIEIIRNPVTITLQLLKTLKILFDIGDGCR